MAMSHEAGGIMSHGGGHESHTAAAAFFGSLVLGLVLRAEQGAHALAAEPVEAAALDAAQGGATAGVLFVDVQLQVIPTGTPGAERGMSHGGGA